MYDNFTNIMFKSWIKKKTENTQYKKLELELENKLIK